MRAVVVEEFGPVESHKLADVPAPTPGPGEVLMDVHAIGVNFPDSLMVQGLYQIKPDRPFTPGRDAAGVVTAVGDGVTSVKPGDRITTLYTFGAYAEQRVVPEATALGAFTGKTALKDGKGIMVDTAYRKGSDYLPGDAEIEKMRPKD